MCIRDSSRAGRGSSMGPMCWWSSLLLRRNRRSYDWYPGPHGSNILPSRTVREQLAGGITGPAAVTTRRGHRSRGTPIGWGCTVGRNEAWLRAVPAATFAWLCRDHQCGRGVPRPQAAQEARVAEPGDVIQPAVDQFRQGDSRHAVVDLAGVSASELTLRIDHRVARISLPELVNSWLDHVARFCHACLLRCLRSGDPAAALVIPAQPVSYTH